MRQSFIWGSFNGFLLLFIVYDLLYNNRIYGSTIHNAEVSICAILFLNLLFHSGRVLWTKFKPTFNIFEVGFKPQVIEKPSPPEEEEVEFSCYQRANWEIITGQEMDSHSKYYSAHFLARQIPSLTLKSTGDVVTQRDLHRYLQEYEEAEKYSFVASSVESHTMLINQFWNNSSSLTPTDVSPVLRRTVYQMSPLSHSSSDSSGHASSDEGGSPISHFSSEFWRKHKLGKYDFVNWISNLRMWISCSIMQSLVDVIEVVNNGLKNQGAVGISVGTVSLDTLMDTAHNIMIVHHIPSLPFLIPFLQVSQNQEYVVQRIKDLAVGTCISDYRWKEGGKLKGKEWDSSLPTDAESVMHMVRSYFDSQLPLLPCEPDARPFTTQYFAKAPDKPRQTDIALYQCSSNPPHYQLYVNGEIQDIPQGRNNLFYALLLFLLHIETYHSGLLGRINLRKSGLNLMWIIEKES